MIELKEISFSFDKKNIFNDLTLSINTGDFLCIIGRNGIGKTTLFNIITQKYTPANGRVVYSNNLQFSDIGLISEDIMLPDYLSILEIFELVSHNYKIREKQRINEVLHKYSLYEYRNCKLSELSSGLRKKVEILQFLISNKKVLILDEPCNSLDLTTRRELNDLLIELNSKGKTILYSSHYMEDVEHIYSHLLVINESKIYKFSINDLALNKNEICLFITDERNILKIWNHLKENCYFKKYKGLFIINEMDFYEIQPFLLRNQIPYIFSQGKVSIKMIYKLLLEEETI